MWELRQSGKAKARNDAFNKIALDIQDLSLGEQLSARLHSLGPRLGEKIVDYMGARDSLAELQGKAAEREQCAHSSMQTPTAAGLSNMGRGNTNSSEGFNVDPKRLGRLTDELKQLLIKEGRRFFCRHKGHALQDCRKRANAQQRRSSGNGGRREQLVNLRRRCRSALLTRMRQPTSALRRAPWATPMLWAAPMLWAMPALKQTLLGRNHVGSLINFELPAQNASISSADAARSGYSSLWEE